MPSKNEKIGSAVRIVALCSVWSVGTLHAADPTGSGPEPAIVYSEQSLPTHTIYRPETLRDDRYPVVLWGNGSCVNSNFGYREFLTVVASHGFIVVAIGPYRDSPAPRQARPAEPADWAPFETLYRQLLDGRGVRGAESVLVCSVFDVQCASGSVDVTGL